MNDWGFYVEDDENYNTEALNMVYFLMNECQNFIIGYEALTKLFKLSKGKIFEGAKIKKSFSKNIIEGNVFCFNFYDYSCEVGIFTTKIFRTIKSNEVMFSVGNIMEPTTFSKTLSCLLKSYVSFDKRKLELHHYSNKSEKSNDVVTDMVEIEKFIMGGYEISNDFNFEKNVKNGTCSFNFCCY